MKNINDWFKKYQASQAISLLTCYDTPSAKIISETNLDAILVGDSVAMVVHGFESTLAATVEMMALHTAAVARGAPNKFIIADMPFLSYRQGLTEAMQAVQKLMQAGAQAIKLEGVEGNIQLIKHIVASGVPVMGHIGLTPQFVNSLGGYRVQGKDAESQQRLKLEAQQLAEAGCFAIVLECVPSQLAAEITECCSVATIGIGAGKQTSGQVLVWHDAMGLQRDFVPKLAKQYCQTAQTMQLAVASYVEEVTQRVFPGEENVYI